MIFTLNVTESIQEKYGTIEAWSNLIQRDGEPNIKALKFFITESGCRINGLTKKRELILRPKSGIIKINVQERMNDDGQNFPGYKRCNI